MKLLRIHDVQLNRCKNIFRESARRRLFVAIVVLLATSIPVLLFRLGKVPLFPVIVMSGGLGLFALLQFTVFLKTRSPLNWLLAIDNDGVLIKFRSYLNAHYPEHDPQIASIPFRHIRAIRIYRGEIKYQEPKRPQYFVEKTDYLDIITVDENLQELQDQLKYERNIRISGKSSYGYYPVSVVDNHIIRIEWKSKRTIVVPQISSAIKVLSRSVNREADIYNKEDFTNRAAPKGKDLEDKIMQLCHQGNTIAAVKIAMEAYQLDTTQAKVFVDKLLKQ